MNEPKDFSVDGKELDSLSYEEAAKIENECEEYWFQRDRKLGRWIPTRELARSALRTALEEGDKMRNHLDWICALLLLDTVAIFALFAILLR